MNASWHMHQHAYFVELICDFFFIFFFFWTRDKEIDTRELEVASAEGLSLEFKCRDKSPASVFITLQFI